MYVLLKSIAQGNIEWNGDTSRGIGKMVLSALDVDSINALVACWIFLKIK